MYFIQPVRATYYSANLQAIHFSPAKFLIEKNFIRLLLLVLLHNHTP